MISVQNYPYVLSCYFHFLPSPVPSFGSAIGSVGGMENFDVKSFWFILWHFNFHPFFSKLGIFPCDPSKFIFWFPWTFFLLRSRGANKKIWYDIIVKNAFLSSHKNVLLQCFSCKGFFCKAAKKEDRSGKNKKSASLERLKCHYSISVVLFRGEFRARYRHTRNFHFFCPDFIPF